jgi:hypothetical protein
MLGLLLYRERQHGTSVEEISAVLGLPESWVEERIEAARLCLEMQVRVESCPMPASVEIPRLREAANSAKENKRRSR